MNNQNDEQQSYIKNELKKFNLTDSALDELSEQYMPLKINGLDDKEGYKKVKSARMLIKNYRIDVDKKRKDMTSGALAFQRAINEEAKRITARLQPIEDYLSAQENIFDEEIERIKRQKEQEEFERIQSRINTLAQYGYKLHSAVYIVDYIDASISSNAIKAFDDDAWNRFLNGVKPAHEEHQAKLQEEKRLLEEKKAIEEAERQAEKERLIQQRREQELEKERLADIARVQAEREAAFKAEQERIKNEQAEKEAALKAESERLESLKFIEEIKTEEIVNKIHESEDPLKTVSITTDNSAFDLGSESRTVIHRIISIDEDYIIKKIGNNFAASKENISNILIKISSTLDDAILECVTSAIKEIMVDAWLEDKQNG